MALVPGARLGPYEVVARLGAGGMGVVYKGCDLRLDRTVAIKVLPDHFASDEQFRDRFQREARAIASLSHPHICTLHDIGEQDGQRFLVMEYLEGETLGARLHRERIPYHTLLNWSIQLCDALAFAHQKGVLHRDLKPANLFVTTAGAIKILDFGLAKRAGDALEIGPTHAVTQVGSAIGTIAYMSPEQARGEPLDHRSDLFSLGAVLYEAATGQPAFTGATSAVVFEAIFSRSISRRAIPPPFPAGFAAIIERLLAKSPRDRFASATEVAQSLRDLAQRRDSDAIGSFAPVRVPSVAVLPFADMSAQKDQDYFCEGMAEELINALGRLPGLRVASRTSAFRFQGAADIHQVGKELGVDTVLEGSVRTAGSRLRVSAQLVNVLDGYQIWSERFDRQLDDVFEIQDQIARAIVDALKIKLFGDDSTIVKRAADNIAAYQLCLKARYYWHKWSDDGYRKAFELFEEAVQTDASCALAHFGLADCYTAAGCSGLTGPEFRGKAEALFEKALTLDPNLAEAHAILGILRGLAGYWDWPRAHDHFATALKLNPRSAHIHSAYSMYALIMGRTDEAVREAQEAVQLDPLMPSWHAFSALVHCYGRRYEDALRAANLALDLDPRSWWAQDARAMSLIALGRREEALDAWKPQLSTTSPYAVGDYGYALALQGRRDEAEEQRYLLVEHRKNAYVPPLSVAVVCAGLRQFDEAFSWLNLAVQERDPQLAFYITGSIALDDVREDSRFAEIRHAVGI